MLAFSSAGPEALGDVRGARRRSSSGTCATWDLRERDERLLRAAAARRRASSSTPAWRWPSRGIVAAAAGGRRAPCSMECKVALQTLELRDLDGQRGRPVPRDRPGRRRAPRSSATSSTASVDTAAHDARSRAAATSASTPSWRACSTWADPAGPSRPASETLPAWTSPSQEPTVRSPAGSRRCSPPGATASAGSSATRHTPTTCAPTAPSRCCSTSETAGRRRGRRRDRRRGRRRVRRRRGPRERRRAEDDRRPRRRGRARARRGRRGRGPLRHRQLGRRRGAARRRRRLQRLPAGQGGGRSGGHGQRAWPGPSCVPGRSPTRRERGPCAWRPSRSAPT